MAREKDRQVSREQSGSWVSGPLCFRSARQSRSVEPRGVYDEISQQWITDGSRRESDHGGRKARADQRVLVVTQKCDPHADVVIAHLKAMGVESFRLNTEDLLDGYVVDWDGTSISLSDRAGRSINVPTGVISAYLRPTLPVTPPGDITDPAMRMFAAAEGERLLDALHSLEGVQWLSTRSALQRAKPKMPQLHLAHQLGLRVPRSLVTNDPQRAREFARSLVGDIALKPQDTPHVVVDGKRNEFFCHTMAASSFTTVANAVRYTPCLLQEFIDKVADVRITIIGSDVFATEIDTSGLDEARADWRLADLDESRYRPIDIPTGLSRTLKRFLKCYGLRFGAIDLLHAKSGEYVFLENNPNGVWYWLERATGQPMTASLARLLAGHGAAG